MKKSFINKLHLLRNMWRSFFKESIILTNDIEAILLLHSQIYWPYVPFNYPMLTFNPILSYSQYLIPNHIDIVISNVFIKTDSIESFHLNMNGKDTSDIKMNATNPLNGTQMPCINEISFPILFSKGIYDTFYKENLNDYGMVLMYVLAMTSSTFQVMDISYASFDWKKYYSLCFMRMFFIDECMKLQGTTIDCDVTCLRDLVYSA
jgi:hypothetical protein